MSYESHTPGSAGLTARLLALAGASALAMAAATGFTQEAVFTQGSGLKYALTIAAPLLLLLALSTNAPLQVFTAAVIVAAPFAGFTATFAGIALPLLAPLLLAAAAAALLTGQPRVPPSSLGVGAVWIVALLALPIATGDAVGRYLVLLATIIVVAWLVSRTALLPGGLELVLGAVVASAALQALIAIWEATSGHRLDLYDAAGTSTFTPDYFFAFGDASRPTGAFYDPISLANALALACPVALALVVSGRSAWIRAAAAAAGVACAVALALSLSRMSWIGAAAGLVLTAALLPRGFRLKALLALAALVAITASVALGMAGGSLGTRFDSIVNPTGAEIATSAGDRERVELWRAAAAAGVEHPLAGVGLGRLRPELSERVSGIGPSSHAHSTYLQILGEAGLLGALAFLVFLAALARDFASGLRRDRALVAGLAGACVALLLGWTTDYTTRYVPVAAMVGVLVGAVASQGKRREAQ